jgi:hypothetical protein
MSLNFSQKRLQKAYLVSQTDPLVVPTFAGTDACLYSKLNLGGNVNLIKNPDITGSRSTAPGKNGRHTSTWSMEMTLASPGAGVTPDCMPLLDCLFGAPGVVTASTNIVWTLSDALNTFAIARYRKPATLGQHIAYGCAVAEATFTLGGDVGMLSASGPNVWTIDSDVFGNLITEAKGGLATFPVEPSSPVTAGDFVIGFTGALTMGGTTIVNLKNASVKISTGSALVTDTFNKFCADGVEADERNISISFTLDDADDAGTKALKAAAYTKAGMDMSIQSGLIAGNKWLLGLKGIQLASPTFDDGQRRFRLNFGDSEAHGTTISSLDEVTLTIS